MNTRTHRHRAKPEPIDVILAKILEAKRELTIPGLLPVTIRCLTGRIIRLEWERDVLEKMEPFRETGEAAMPTEIHKSNL